MSSSDTADNSGTEQPRQSSSPSQNGHSAEKSGQAKNKRRRRRGGSANKEGGAPPASAKSASSRNQKPRRKTGTAKKSDAPHAGKKGAVFDPEGVYSGASYAEKNNAELGVGDFDAGAMSEAFQALNLDPALLRAAHGMGYLEPTPIQRDAIPVALSGKDVVGCAQTGTGKTAAFALPTLQHLKGGSGTRALTLVPTRELAVQVGENFRELGKHVALRTGVIYGGVDYEPQIRALNENVDIVVATPGRLIDLMNRKTANFSRLEILILDEADRMLDMGFAEEINEILKRVPKNRQTMLFSATIPSSIESLSRRALRDPEKISMAPPSTPAEGIHHAVLPLLGQNKQRAVMAILEQADATSVLIFSRTKSGADQLSDFLEARGISVARIHSDRSQRQREKALSGFREGRHRVLVATDIASRGIDVSGISHVINYNVPEYPEDYVHRAGRTARAGKVGYAYSMMSSGEIAYIKNIERFIGKALPRIGLPSLQDDVHQRGLEGEPVPLKNQPPVARYERFQKLRRRSGLSLR